MSLQRYARIQAIVSVLSVFQTGPRVTFRMLHGAITSPNDNLLSSLQDVHED